MTKNFDYKVISKDNNGAQIMMTYEPERVVVPAQPMSDEDYSNFTL